MRTAKTKSSRKPRDKGGKTNTITRCLRLKIVKKPLNCTWLEAVKALTYARRACSAGSNYTQTLLLRDDDAFACVAADESRAGYKLPTGTNGKVKLPKHAALSTQIYHYVREQFPYLSARIVSYILKNVQGRYRDKRIDILSGRCSAPTYRNPLIQTDQYAIEQTDHGIVLHVSVLSEKSNGCPGRISFPLNTSKVWGKHRDVLDEIVRGERKRQTISLVFHPRKNDWMVHIPFEFIPSKPELVADRVMFVYPPGERQFLICECRPKTNNLEEATTNKTDRWHELLESGSVPRWLKGYEDRSKLIARKYRQDSTTSSHGHGRKRALKNKSRRQAKYRRVCRTFNQQRAAHAIRLALRWKCGIIKYSSPADWEETYRFSDSWPWHEFEQCLRNKAEEHGIKFVKLRDDSDGLKLFQARAEAE